METYNDLNKAVEASFHKFFNGSYAASDTKGNFRFYFGKTEKELKTKVNGSLVQLTDALDLKLNIDVNPKSGYNVTFQKDSIRIKPESKYGSYASHELKLKQFKVKPTADLLKKLDKTFQTVNNTTKALLKSGSMDNHGPEVVKMIKKRTK